MSLRIKKASSLLARVWKQGKKYLSWRLTQDDNGGIDNELTHGGPRQKQIDRNINQNSKITVVNNTGNSGTAGRNVSVMLFQKLLDSSITADEYCAWQVVNINYPGKFGPLDLPKAVEFYVIDYPCGAPREHGPVKVNFGDVIDVTQTTEDEAPTAAVVSSRTQYGGIKANNLSGNVQPLEMALYKNGRKIVSVKEVNPASSVYLAIKPAIYIAKVDRIVQGQDSVAIHQLTTEPAEIELFDAKPNVEIQITQLPSGKLKFSEL